MAVVGPPDAVVAKLGSWPGAVEARSPWLSWDWPLQVDRFGWWATAAATDVDWARAILQLRLEHPPWPLAAPATAEASDETLQVCWGLNRLVQGPQLDQALAEAGYGAIAHRDLTVSRLKAQAAAMPELSCLLLVLELLYRGISPIEQEALKEACGPEVMRAAYQMNMMCVVPDDPDRTLLQVQRLALKVMGESGAAVQAAMRVTLSNGQVIGAIA